MDLIKALAEILMLPEEKIRKTVELIQADNTVPFIARYRKEVTGNLDEEQINQIKNELNRLENLEDRRQTILQSIEKQGKLDENLKRLINAATNLTSLEDLYLPYRPKRKTRATVAREKGLEPLAHMILQQQVTDKSLQSLVSPFINPDVPDIDSALAGASDILAEMISENAAIRQGVREKCFVHGKITCEKIPASEDQRLVYEHYYQFSIPIVYIKPHQVLAINRGEREKILKIEVTLPERDWIHAIHSLFKPERRSLFFDILSAAIEDGAQRLLLPAIARDVRRQLSEQAESHAIKVFAKNLQGLLTQPPLADQVILAIDPGFRTGSKVAVVDPTGKLLETTTIYPHPPQNLRTEAHQTLIKLISTHQVTLIVIGNGTASRETEQFIAEITKNNSKLHYLITSEAGASVYSASKLARKEFPDLDVSLRGAISIARRVQDPLAELVKIDPKSIGVGLYQHDVDQKQLSNALDQVVETVVNTVGVDVNTASAALLQYVAGIGPVLAEKIINYREAGGAFKERTALMAVPGIGAKSFQQSAGFLRIRDGLNPLDNTAIHPESYPVAEKVLDHFNYSLQPGTRSRRNEVPFLVGDVDLESLANTLHTGLPTLKDILRELARPGRDPREDIPKPILRSNVLSTSDLTPGMALKGTIRNVVDFGAFVDIGVKVDGLLHRSKIKSGTILNVGDIVDVVVLSIDQERGRISLQMKEIMNDRP
jgi:protein Tex